METDQFYHPRPDLSRAARFWLTAALSPERTIQSEQRREFPAIVHPGRIRRARHPQVFVDGGGGDDVAVHGGRPPVTVGQAHPHHHPSQEPQDERHYFHDWIHDPSSGWPSSERISRCEFWTRHASLVWPVSDRVSEICKSQQIMCIMIYTSCFLLPLHLTHTYETEQVFIRTISRSNGHCLW